MKALFGKMANISMPGAIYMVRSVSWTHSKDKCGNIMEGSLAWIIIRSNYVRDDSQQCESVKLKNSRRNTDPGMTMGLMDTHLFEKMATLLATILTSNAAETCFSMNGIGVVGLRSCEYLVARCSRSFCSGQRAKQLLFGFVLAGGHWLLPGSIAIFGFSGNETKNSAGERGVLSESSARNRGGV